MAGKKTRRDAFDAEISLMATDTAYQEEATRIAQELAAADDLRPEYDFDFSKGERGRYFKRLLKEGGNIAVLEPDIAKAFPDSASVNKALRSLLEVARLDAQPERLASGPPSSTLTASAARRRSRSSSPSQRRSGTTEPDRASHELRRAAVNRPS